MANPASTKVPPKGSAPIAPTEDEWRAMTLDERESLLVKINDALSASRNRTGMVEHLEAEAQEAEARAQDAIARADVAVAGMREAVLMVLDARGIVCSDDARGRILSCDDPAVLRRWLTLARAATTAADVLEVESGDLRTS